MKITDYVPQLRALSPLGWAAAAIGVLAVIAVAWWLITAAGRHKSEAAGAKVEASLAKSRTASAAAAVEITTAAGARDAATDTTTQENRDAILSAPGADVRLDPRLGAAGRAGLCKRAAYSGHPECVQQPHPVEPPQARPRG